MAGSSPDRLLRVLSHPVRIEILRILHNRVASPKELADELGENLGNISYHFRYLRIEDCIEILDTEPRRGAVEHYHRAKPLPPHDEESWAELPQAARREISGVALRNLIAEAVRALDAGGFDAHPDRRLGWMPMELDAKGWSELTELQAEWTAELERIEAEAAERLGSDGDAPAKRVIAGAIGFETPPGPGFTGVRQIADAGSRPPAP